MWACGEVAQDLDGVSSSHIMFSLRREETTPVCLPPTRPQGILGPWLVMAWWPLPGAVVWNHPASHQDTGVIISCSPPAFFFTGGIPEMAFICLIILLCFLFSVLAVEVCVSACVHACVLKGLWELVRFRSGWEAVIIMAGGCFSVCTDRMQRTALLRESRPN